MGKGKPSEIWKEIKPRIGDMVTAANDMEQSFDKAVREAYEKGYLDAAHNCHEMCDFLDDEKKEAYQRGLNDAWEATRKIQDTGGNLNWWIHNTSASEAIENIRKYEQKKEEIHVGDEVKCIRVGWTAIITKIKEDGRITLMGNDGAIANGYDEKDFIKTGRHFHEIAEVLRKMKEKS